MLGLLNENPNVNTPEMDELDGERGRDQDQPQDGDENTVLPASPAAQVQLSLFQNCYAPVTLRERQSHVIEIWDAAPKYCTPRRSADLTGKTPHVLERTFEFRGTQFRMRVAPVVFKTSSGEDAVRLPTAREELNYAESEWNLWRMR